MANVFTTSMSGMLGYQSMLDVTANNIANAETNGFKTSRVDFSDQFYNLIQSPVPPGGTTGGSNPSQVGNGVQVASVSVQFIQGPIQPTGRDLDLAITGNGFFTLRDPGGTSFYSRVGSFAFDGGSPRTLVDTATGFQVLNTKGKTISPVESLPATATTSLKLGGNLPPTSTVPLTGSRLNSLFALKMTDGTAVSGSSLLSATTLANSPQAGPLSLNLFGTAPDGIAYAKQVTLPANATVQQLVTAVNSALNRPNGSSTLQFATASLDQGRISVTGQIAGSQMNLFMGEQPPPAQPASLAAANTWQYGTGADTYAWSRLRFTPESVSDTLSLYTADGTRHEVDARWFSASTVTTGTGLDTDNQRKWDLIADVPKGGTLVPGSDALHDLTFNVDGTLLNPPTGQLVTNWTVGGASSVTFDVTSMRGFQGDAFADSTDLTGSKAGTLQTISVDQFGQVNGGYSNDKTVAMSATDHQIGLATFSNTAGLLSDGQNLWSPTANSGEPKLVAPGTAATNLITSGALEGSNVDMTNQFTNLITAQRGFQANSKAFQTGDQMLTEAFSLFR